MQSKLLRKFGGLVATAAVTLFLIGCNGKSGQNGVDGAQGPAGPAGPGGSGGTTMPANAINVGMLSTDDWSKLTIQGEIIGTPAVSATAGAPVVKFKLHDENGNPLVGMGKWTTQSGTANVATMPNLYFTIAKLIPADPTTNAPSKWVNYIVTTIPTKATGQPVLSDPTRWNLSTPSTDAVAANLVDNNDGTYQYTFYHDITKTVAAYTNYTDANNNHKADVGTATELTFDPTAVHRLVVVAGGSARNTGNSSTHDQNTATGADSGVPAVPTNTAANIWVDFQPSTGTVVPSGREIVDTASCNACHTKLGISFHNNTRVETQFCVTCHTEQRKFGSADTAFSAAYTNPTGKIAGQAQGTFPTFIHRLHMGEELVATGYNYGSLNYAGVHYPQGKACSTCHSGTAIGATVATAQGEAWWQNPSRFTCGACHDDIDWSVAHQGAVRTDDSACKGCHVQASNPTYYDIKVAHTGNQVSIHNPTTPTKIASFTYEIGTITYDGSHNLVVPFRIKKDGAYVTHLATAPSVTNAATGVKVLNPDARPMPDFPGFIGGPAFVVNYAQPMDGFAAPADYTISLSVGLPNLLVAAGSPSMGSVTLTADANNYFVATITGDLVGQAAPVAAWVNPANPEPTSTAAAPNTGAPAYWPLLNQVKQNPMAIPANATLVTVALRGAFTQVDFTGVDATIAPRYAYVKGDPTAYTTGGTNGGSLAAPKAIAQTGGLALAGPMVRKAVVATSARRHVIDNNKCNACHDSLGIQPAFHGAVNPNGNNAAPVANGGAYGAGTSTDGDQCNACHLPSRAGNTGWTAGASQFVHGIHGASNRSNSYNWHGSATYNYGMLEYPAVLNNCEQCHLPGTYDFTATASANALPNLLWTTVAGSAPSWSATGVVTNTSNATYISTGLNAPYLATAPGAVSNGAAIPTYTVAIGNGYLGTTTQGNAPNQITALVPYPAGVASLVNSPITTVCSSCHDSAAAIGHFKSTGGTFYEPRSSTSLVSPIPVGAKTEGCLTCHGAGAAYDIKVVHKIDLLKK